MKSPSYCQNPPAYRAFQAFNLQNLEMDCPQAYLVQSADGDDYLPKTSHSSGLAWMRLRYLKDKGINHPSAPHDVCEASLEQSIRRP
jgi:hypothetical protein